MSATRAPGRKEARVPRRMQWQARHEQLTAVAMPLVADQGFADFSLEEVTSRAGVTRKLLYHYFPRGRTDVVLAVVKRSGHELTDGWNVDERLTLPERQAANMAHLASHAMRQTDAWRIYRLARTTNDPEIRAIVEDFVEIVISSTALNHLGTPEPPALPRLAIRAFFAFFESALDDSRATGAPLAQVTQLLSDTLRATIHAALAASHQEQSNGTSEPEPSTSGRNSRRGASRHR
jgi:AcrR family transcriptional regulator